MDGYYRGGCLRRLVYGFEDTENNLSGAGTGNTLFIIDSVKEKLKDGYVFGKIDIKDNNLKRTLQEKLGVTIN